MANMANLRNPDSVNWNEPFKPGENLRILTPIAQARVPKWARRHLAAMTPERRAELEHEWMEAEAAVPSVRNPISDELKARADAEWEQL